MSITRRERRDRTQDGRARPWLLTGAALVAVAAVLTGIVASRGVRFGPPADAASLRLAWAAPDGLTIGAGTDYPFGLSLGPDGRRLVFPASRIGLVQLWLSDLTTGEAQVLPETDDGVLPFWAPDGRSIGFFARGRLKVITLENGTVTDLAAAPVARGGAWHPSGDIVFAPDNEGGLVRRRGSDGAIEPLTTLDRSAGESSHRHPTFFDGGRHVAFFVRASESARQGIWIASTERPDTRQRLAGTDAHGVAAGGAVLYSSGGSLVAHALDLEMLTGVGRPMLVGTAVGASPHNQLFATLNGDVLLYGAPASGLRELKWVDRTGAPIGMVGEAFQAWDVRVSPTGDHVAVAGVDPQLGTLDIWAYDGERPLPRRVSTSIDADESPVWSRDGTRVAWVSGRRTILVRGTLAELPEESIRKFEQMVRVSDWSPDGQWVVVSESRAETRDDLWLVPAQGGADPRAYAQSPFNERQGAISPDGKWMAYASDESGRFEIYVDSFPAPGTRGRLTSGGGSDPRWKADGSELFFRRGTELHVVRPTLSDTPPVAASSDRLFDVRVEIRAYDVTRDGQRFLLNLPAAQSGHAPISVLVNWQRLLHVAVR